MNNTQQFSASPLSFQNHHSTDLNSFSTATKASGVDSRGHKVGYSEADGYLSTGYLSKGGAALSSGVSLLTRLVRSIAVNGLQMGANLLGKAGDFAVRSALTHPDVSMVMPRPAVLVMATVWNEIRSAQAQTAPEVSHQPPSSAEPTVRPENQCDGVSDLERRGRQFFGPDEATCTPDKCKEINQDYPRILCGDHCLEDTPAAIKYCTDNGYNVRCFDDQCSSFACNELAQQQGMPKMLCTDEQVDIGSREFKGVCMNATQAMIENCRSENKTVEIIPPVAPERWCDGRSNDVPTVLFPRGSDEAAELCTPEKCQEINQNFQRILCGEDFCLEDTKEAANHCAEMRRNVSRFPGDSPLVPLSRTQEAESSFSWDPFIITGVTIAGVSAFSYLTYQNGKALAQQEPLSCNLVGEAVVKTLTTPFFYKHHGESAVADHTLEHV